jgi:hypothetical protein
MISEANASPIESAGRALRETFDIQERLRRNPYAMVAGAVGLGFVLGGGLFTRLAAKILGTGLRLGLMVALPVLQKGIVLHGNPERVPMPSRDGAPLAKPAGSHATKTPHRS